MKINFPTRRFVRHACLIGCLVLTTLAFAKPEFWIVFQDKYKIRDSSHLGQLKCAVCHDIKPPERNAFGKQVLTALDAAKANQMTPQILDHAGFESALGDGVRNSVKIAADVSPIEPMKDMKAGDSMSPPIGGFTLFPTHFYHPLFVHFPIALMLAGLLLDVMGMRRKKELFARAAILNYGFACLAYPVAVGAGLAAWIVRFHATTDPTSLWHLGLGLLGGVTSVGLYLYRSRAKEVVLSPGDVKFWVLAVITAASITVGGHLGSLLSGV